MTAPATLRLGALLDGVELSGLAEALGTTLRTTWRAAAAWVVALGGTMALTTFSIAGLYDTPAKIRSYADAVAAGDALVAINGRVAGIASLGGITANEFGFIASFAVPLMGVSLVARGTRREEAAGRLEALLAGTVGRSAPLAAALLVTAGALLAGVLTFAVAMVAAGVDATGAVLYALSLGLLAAAFAGLAAVAAQLVGHARGVTGAGLAALVLAYLVRGVGDVQDSWVGWLSPLGWAEETRAFGDARWWPLLVPAAVTAVLVTVALALTGRRDLGSALTHRGAGDPQARPVLTHPLGLAVHLHRGAALGWGAAAVVTSVTFGALARQAQDAISGNPSLAGAFGGQGGDPSDVYVALTVLLLGLLAAGFVVQAVGTARAEEGEQRLEPVLAGALSRRGWLAAQTAAVVGGLLLVAGAGAAALGLASAWSLGDAGQVGRLVASAAAYLPVALVLGGLALALLGAAPRLGALAWLGYAFTAAVGLLGDPLSLPDAVTWLSPTDHVGYPPLTPAPAAGLVGLLLVALVLGAIGFAGLRRRDVPRT